MAITFHANGDVTGSGAANFGASGNIVQYVVVPPNNVNNRRSHNANSWYGTSVVASITPTNANNRIVIESAFCCYSDNSSGGGYLSWSNQAGGTDVELQKCMMYSGDGNAWNMVPVRFEQIAGTTSQLNFELNMWRYNAGTFYIGWASAQDGSTTDLNGAYAHIMEIKV